MTYSQTLSMFMCKIKNIGEWDKDGRGEQWYGDMMIPLTEYGDQRSAKKGNIKKGKTCEKRVVGEKRCEGQPRLVVACLKVENIL